MKKTIGLLILIIIFCLALPASGSFWVKGNGFYYSPDYGDLGDGLEKVKGGYDTPLVLGAGLGAALSVGYDFSENWGVRVDSFKFTGIAEYHHLVLPDIFYFETSTSPTLFSIVYQILPQGKLGYYVAAGVGKFPSELTITSNINPGVHYTDSPIGWQALVGTEYRFKQFVLSSQVRYLSAKAEYPGYRCLESCSTDWSGLFISLGVGISL